MRTAGIREVRQNITALLEHVKKGHEVTITDRGKPVALLSAPRAKKKRGLPDLSAFRKSLNLGPGIGDRLIEIICEERNDRF
jgi:prevent-host-death family protein